MLAEQRGTFSVGDIDDCPVSNPRGNRPAALTRLFSRYRMLLDRYSCFYETGNVGIIKLREVLLSLFPPFPLFPLFFTYEHSMHVIECV